MSYGELQTLAGLLALLIAAASATVFFIVREVMRGVRERRNLRRIAMREQVRNGRSPMTIRRTRSF